MTKVVIVDDDPSAVALYASLATKWGYVVACAPDGMTGWDLIRSCTEPSIILLDWVMPDPDGLEICQRIKRQAELPYLHVIMLTSRSARSDVVEALDRGASDFVAKPVEAPMLRSRLAAAARVVQSVSVRQDERPTLSGYTIHERIGRGSRGEVYRAQRIATEADVALKLLRSDRISEQTCLRFDREVELLRRLEHPNIVRMVDAGIEHGLRYIAMEFLVGTDVETHCRQLGLQPEGKVRLIREAARGLAYAHACGVLHRDLKPSNVFVTLSGEVRLLDFGLAKDLQEAEEDLHLTQDGYVVGTPAFMSPEQAAFQTERMGPASDVYSLGVVLYRLLTGSHPHKLQPPITAMMQRIATEPAIPPGQVMPHLPTDMQRVLERALARSPADRYATMDHFERALGNLLGQR